MPKYFKDSKQVGLIWLTGLCLGAHFDPGCYRGKNTHACKATYPINNFHLLVPLTSCRKPRVRETGGTEKYFLCAHSPVGRVEEIFESLRTVAKVCLAAVSSWQT